MRAAVLEYLATSSMATVRPRIPAPDPPYSSGMHRPSSPASRNASKMSVGYELERSIARARGLTLSRARRRTVDCSADNSGERSKSISREAMPAAATAAHPRGAALCPQRHGDLDLHGPAPGQGGHPDGGPGVAA